MATERIRTLTTRPNERSAPRTFKVASRAGRRRRTLLIAGLSAVVLWPLFAWLAARWLIVKADLPSADAIVVLSGSSTYRERTAWAAKLYREGRAPIVILTNDSLISGWNNAEERNPYFYELAEKELQQGGVPAEKIQVVSDIALGTYEESLGLRDYATAHSLKRLLVVTSAYHTRRALWSMRHASERSGIEVGIDSPPPGWQTPAPSRWWLRRWGWRVVAGEYVKMIYYWMRY
ncbi:MAG: YdcF family protein [Acidobacteriota bacterium]